MKPPTKTSTERARKLRQRDEAAGIAEVRGIKAPVQHHDEIKVAARAAATRITERARKREKEQPK